MDRYCQRCGTLIVDPAATFCSRCGANLGLSPSVQATPVEIKPGAVVTVVPMHVNTPKRPTAGYAFSDALEDLGNATIALIIPGLNILIALWAIFLHAKAIDTSKRAATDVESADLRAFSSTRGGFFWLELLETVAFLILISMKFLTPSYTVTIIVSCLVPVLILTVFGTLRSWNHLLRFFEGMQAGTWRTDGIVGVKRIMGAAIFSIPYYFVAFFNNYMDALYLVIPVSILVIPTAATGFFRAGKGIRKYWAEYLKSQTPPIVGQVYQVNPVSVPAPVVQQQAPRPAPVPVSTPVPPVTKKVPEPAKKFCPMCGAVLPPEERILFCPECGTGLE